MYCNNIKIENAGRAEFCSDFGASLRISADGTMLLNQNLRNVQSLD